MDEREIDLGAERGVQPDVTLADDLLEAIDQADEECAVTWLCRDGRRIAAIVPAEDWTQERQVVPGEVIRQAAEIGSGM